MTMTMTEAPANGARPASTPRHSSVDALVEAGRVVRIARVRAREARVQAAACESRARRGRGLSTMYLAEAHRLRREATLLDIKAGRHEAALQVTGQRLAAALPTPAS
jgi:hypothetical protein